MKKSTCLNVFQLAEVSGNELDDTLLILWEAGINNVNGPNDKICGNKLGLAKRLLSLPTKNQITSIEYWKTSLGIMENLPRD
jgi:hypothetical protein